MGRFNVYEPAKRDPGYVPRASYSFVSAKAGVEAARELITSDRPLCWLYDPWEKGRLDPSFESLVVESAYESLLATHERELAGTRLHDLECHSMRSRIRGD